MIDLLSRSGLRLGKDPGPRADRTPGDLRRVLFLLLPRSRIEQELTEKTETVTPRLSLFPPVQANDSRSSAETPGCLYAPRAPPTPSQIISGVPGIASLRGFESLRHQRGSIPHPAVPHASQFLEHPPVRRRGRQFRTVPVRVPE